MIIIPDIHGRTFWQKAVGKAKADEKIIFLGDYVDPYFFENLDPIDGLEQLERVIQFKKEHPSQVVLLLGNHDMTYLFPKTIFASRHDFKNELAIQKQLRENIGLFQMAHYEVFAGKQYIFSHAGINPGWLEVHNDVFGSTNIDEAMVCLCNQLLQQQDKRFLSALADVSARRGGHNPFGSMIWADVEEYLFTPFPKIQYQIFGHTQQVAHAVITSQYACLDCRMAFRLNEQDGFLSAIEEDSSNTTDSNSSGNKIIFLDFDGVLHSEYYDLETQSFHTSGYDEYGPLFDPLCIENLALIIKQTGAKIVVSSSWREDMSLDELYQMWTERKLPGKLEDVTPLTDGDRGDDIKAWLDAHPTIHRYIILDDLDGSHFKREQIDHLVPINPFMGIEIEDAERAIRMLKP